MSSEIETAIDVGLALDAEPEASGEQRVVELIGVYHADGGPVGEVKYVLGKILGTAHCALCDVTHSPVRRKPEWDAMVARLGIPVRLVHLNEQDPDVARATRTHGSPIVLARMSDDSLRVALAPGDLEGLGGSVSAFEEALGESLAREDWSPS